MAEVGAPQPGNGVVERAEPADVGTGAAVRTVPPFPVALLLYASGACALVYQVAWLREMRLIFGASTASSAAVLAIFMGGLGVGGILLGRRADRHPQPLALYAHLELLIAASAAATPVLVWLAREAYMALGGSVVLGLGVATGVRLMLATMVLCVPTILMGGTLPAAARAVETSTDVGRRSLALLYGVNTLGAVTGAFCATFFMLEAFGVRLTLWLACAANLVVAIVARGLASTLAAGRVAPVGAPTKALPAADARGVRSALPPASFVLIAAATVGFAFLLMELVWYRMLGPLLGGSSYTFGLILAVALFGVGVGSVGYTMADNRRPATLGAFALTCTIEAVALAVPYALGDRIAFLTIFLRPLDGLGFGGLVASWAAVVALVVLPAAIIAGVQFPMLIALLGRGEEKIGQHVGLAYAWNTAGAILGALTGGFWLLPVLTAPGTWVATVVLLLSLGIAAIALSWRAGERLTRLWAPAALATAAVALLTASGPTAVWRHTPIGPGRIKFTDTAPNSLRDWANSRRRVVAWEREGVESSIALHDGIGYAFLVNGKSDGNARLDAPTQVMSGLVAAILHPNPRRALVIGLGTGSTAGWLAAVPSIERVDVVELEPAILDVARASSPVNENALDNPKVHIFIGDAREVLLTSRERYDVILSEPSNPYRAGVASLFTREFYEAVAQRLEPDGIFIQWLQGYEVDRRAVVITYATLASVFDFVETWHTHPRDLLLVGTKRPIRYDSDTLRARVEQEPYKKALAVAWRTAGLEGLLSHHIARPSFAAALAESGSHTLNTDDRSALEFAVARTVGRELFDTAELRDFARSRQEDRPAVDGEVDWERVEDERLALMTSLRYAPQERPDHSAAQRHRIRAQANSLSGNSGAVLGEWRAQPQEPRGIVEVAVVAEAFADTGNDAALGYIETLSTVQPIESAVLLGILRSRQRRLEEATQAFEIAFASYRHDPWPLPTLMTRGLDFALAIARVDPSLGRRLYEVIKTPFSVSVSENARQRIAWQIARAIDFKGLCVEALQSFEPDVAWERDFLVERERCYRETGDPRAARALRELDEFSRHESVPLAQLVTATPPHE